MMMSEADAEADHRRRRAIDDERNRLNADRRAINHHRGRLHKNCREDRRGIIGWINIHGSGFECPGDRGAGNDAG